jgi:hypothetical protein
MIHIKLEYFQELDIAIDFKINVNVLQIGSEGVASFKDIHREEIFMEGNLVDMEILNINIIGKSTLFKSNFEFRIIPFQVRMHWHKSTDNAAH